MRRLLPVLTVVLFAPAATGLVMNANTGTLPPGCDDTARWENVTVHAGKAHAQRFPGTMFTYDTRSLQFPPCTKLTVTLVNNDSVRHQWMVHDLPQEMYPMGMFTIEVTGPGRDTGTFILPGHDETLLVHCGLPQHMEKGMKAQLLVGDGHGTLPNIPGISAGTLQTDYPVQDALPAKLILFSVAIVLGGATTVAARRRLP